MDLGMKVRLALGRLFILLITNVVSTIKCDLYLMVIFTIQAYEWTDRLLSDTNKFRFTFVRNLKSVEFQVIIFLFRLNTLLRKVKLVYVQDKFEK